MLSNPAAPPLTMLKAGARQLLAGWRPRGHTAALVRAAGLRAISTSEADIYARTGLDPSIFKGRKVVIFKPPPASTQNGKHIGKEWKLQ